MGEAITLIWKVSVLAELAVAIRLLLQGLGGEYPALLTACIVLPMKSLLLMASLQSFAYKDQARLVARNLNPVEWIVSALVVFELFARWTGSYEGIGRFGKYLLAGLLTGASVISLAFLHAEWQVLDFASGSQAGYIIDRVVWGILAVFVIGTWVFFRNYPVAISPNVLRHTQISMIYFAVGALSLLIFTLNGRHVAQEINLAIVMSTCGCFCAWAILLTRRGEVAPPVQVVSQIDRDRIEKLNQELLGFMGDLPKNGR
ncbi:MAG TPA: hypothetical protein VGL72_23805 [Bryobacteraceae bacterium]|jgi:hypothetical protein